MGVPKTLHGIGSIDTSHLKLPAPATKCRASWCGRSCRVSAVVGSVAAAGCLIATSIPGQEKI